MIFPRLLNILNIGNSNLCKVWPTSICITNLASASEFIFRIKFSERSHRFLLISKSSWTNNFWLTTATLPLSTTMLQYWCIIYGNTLTAFLHYCIVLRQLKAIPKPKHPTTQWIETVQSQYNIFSRFYIATFNAEKNQQKHVVGHHPHSFLRVRVCIEIVQTPTEQFSVVFVNWFNLNKDKHT